MLGIIRKVTNNKMERNIMPWCKSMVHHFLRCVGFGPLHKKGKYNLKGKKVVQAIKDLERIFNEE